MKIAFTAEIPSLDGSLDPRFGRCPYLLLVENQDEEPEIIENPFAGETGGAGTRVAQLLAEKKVERVYTGHCGPNAREVLDQAGIEVVQTGPGRIRGILDGSNPELPVAPLADVKPNPAAPSKEEPEEGGRGLGRRRRERQRLGSERGGGRGGRRRGRGENRN